MGNFIANAIAVLAIGIVSGLMLSIIVTPIYLLLRKIFIVPIIRKRLMEKAIAQGHVVQATRVKYFSDRVELDDGDSLATNEKIAIYEYVWNNKKYKRRIECILNPPDELTLYFLRKPSKATVPNALGIFERDCSIIKSYLVIALIIGCVFGGIGACILNAR